MQKKWVPDHSLVRLAVWPAARRAWRQLGRGPRHQTVALCLWPGGHVQAEAATRKSKSLQTYAGVRRGVWDAGRPFWREQRQSGLATRQERPLSLLCPNTCEPLAGQKMCCLSRRTISPTPRLTLGRDCRSGRNRLGTDSVSMLHWRRGTSSQPTPLRTSGNLAGGPRYRFVTNSGKLDDAATGNKAGALGCESV